MTTFETPFMPSSSPSTFAEEPTPWSVLFDAILNCPRPVNVPEIRIVRGSSREAALASSSAVRTVTTSPSPPPVVLSTPRPLTAAQPIGAAAVPAAPAALPPAAASRITAAQIPPRTLDVSVACSGFLMIGSRSVL